MPYAAMLLVVVFWGSAASVGRGMGDAGTALGLATWRVGLGLALLIVVLAASAAWRRVVGTTDVAPSSPAWPLSKRHIPIWLGGMLGYGIMIWLFFEAARTTLSSHLVLILSLAPICTMLLDRMSGGQGDNRSFMPATLSLAGIVIMIAPSLFSSAPNGAGASFGGDVMALLALLSFSAFTVLTKRYKRGLSALAVNVHGMSAGLALLLALFVLTEGRLLPPAFSTREDWLAMGYLGLASTGLAYLLYAWALSRMTMERVMPLIYLQPLVGVLLSVIWLDEELTLSVLLGMCGILGGLLWNHRYTSKQINPITRRNTNE
jgi:drug/metabolite transporter (DMT)-like permease